MNRSTRVLLAAAIAILLLHPLQWLVRTWTDPSYGSTGALSAGLVLTLIVTAVRSGPGLGSEDLSRARNLFIGTALLRALAELTVVRTLGASALVVDVYALSLALGLSTRPSARDPVGLAVLFALSLPMERMFERGLGHPLQLLAARLACRVLSTVHPSVTCHGTQISDGKAQLSVDLPCSGAQSLVLLLMAWATLWAVRRLQGRRIILGLIAVLGGTLASSTLRIAVLALFLQQGVDVASEPGHSLIGLGALAVGFLPLALFVRAPSAPESRPRITQVTPIPVGYARALFALSVVATAVPAQPLDISGSVEPATLPVSLGSTWSEPIAPDPKETLYFQRYGGAFEKRRYFDQAGSFTALTVRTRSPLRHLHNPKECLAGSGHDVRLVGVRPDKTSVYRSVDPSGNVWRVEVTFVNASGVRAESPSEVAWSWLESPFEHWSMVQRISPYDLCERQPQICQDRENALFLALDIPSRTTTPEVVLAERRTP